MKKPKLIYSDFNEKTGISTAVIQTPKGMYDGYSMLRAEDANHVSKIEGCRIAEMKACIKMVKAEIKEIKIQLSAFEKFYNAISTSKHFNAQSFEARRLRKEIFKLKERIKELEGLKDYNHNILMESINMRQKRIDAFYKQFRRISQVKNN